jgi:lipopolysaccharide export system permease protein
LIISRYLSKEITGALFAVTFVFLLVFLSNWLVRYLSYAASGKLAANILLQLMGFEIPYLLALLLPLGLYLGIVLAYGRLYADNEMRVLQACGLSTKRLITMTSGVVLVVMAVVLVLMLWVNPWIANVKGKLIAHSVASENVLDTLMPGRFQVSNDGRRVVYVEKISRNRQHAENLFIADQHQAYADESNSEWMVVSAEQGSQVKDLATGDRFIVAENGFRYEGVPGENEYKIIQFKKYSVLIPQSLIKINHQEQEAIPTSTLWKTYDIPQNAAELQWRFSIAFSALLLALLAIPLSYVRPRHGKYSQLLPAILIYIVYVNLLFVARNWIELKILPIALGMWWVHLLLFLLAVGLIKLQTGFVRQTS